MKLFSSLFVLLTAVPALVNGMAPNPITGIWLTHSDKGIIRISSCGAGVCGALVALGPGSPKDAPHNDYRNNNPTLRNRPLTGLQIIENAKPEGDHWTGSIYSPEDGRSYTASFAPVGDGTLRVRGCWGFLCLTQIWKPANRS
jgi:uncharacterized protein (DUF2147 family)